MREIKFRAWDEDRKIMINDFSSRVHDTTYELIQSSDDGNFFCGNYMENGDWQEPILMQFTGLTDKNGKEIYEGDIIQWNNTIQKGASKIVFYDGCFRIADYPFEDFNKLETGHKVEIIGNIYENPNLLENL